MGSSTRSATPYVLPTAAGFTYSSASAATLQKALFTRTKEMKTEPNNAMERSRILVTDCAGAHSAPSIRLAHLGRSAKNSQRHGILPAHHVLCDHHLPCARVHRRRRITLRI